uniref:Rad21/Rec8-like protein C-terminal eukaryotic domain-containing protein n=1 Tax=Echeneis naucrates TaxID=173247 RepID=A0A665TGX4_ECHNA
MDNSDNDSDPVSIRISGVLNVSRIKTIYLFTPNNPQPFYSIISQSAVETRFALKALCEGCTRSQAAATFFCLLVLKKQQALYLYQSAPYEDIIIIIPGPTFYDQ